MVCVILTLFEPLIAEVSVELVESDAPGSKSYDTYICGT